MFRTLREDWRRLEHGTPGRRFEELYSLRRTRRENRHSTSRIFVIATGTILVVVSPVVGVVPGPGGLVVFVFGFVLLASELRPAARLLDRCEPRARTVWAALRRAWRRIGASRRRTRG
jgi:hypothetical protein